MEKQNWRQRARLNCTGRRKQEQLQLASPEVVLLPEDEVGSWRAGNLGRELFRATSKMRIYMRQFDGGARMRIQGNSLPDLSQTTLISFFTIIVRLE